MSNAQAQAPYVPNAYPSTAISTPTGASEESNADATIGADAAPPTFACDPTATKKKGARMIFATTSNMITCTSIQINPIAKRPGFLNISPIFICIPIVATKM